MGAILAKFRKTRTTEEILEGLDVKIQELENYTINTQQQKKRFVGTFVAFSLGIYVIAFLIIYFIYLPQTWSERFIYFIPLLIFPILIIFLRRLFTWYFQRKLNRNSEKVMALRAEKKKLLEDVMDKETYKVAVNLLARFGDKSSSRLSLGTSHLARSGSKTVQAVPSPSAVVAQSRPGYAGRGNVKSFSLAGTPEAVLSGIPTSSSVAVGTMSDLTGILATPTRPDQALRRRTPFPIINEKQKGIFERCVDLLIGDGPQDRFGMICKECHGHNGMALKEEFYYTAFRCAFCGAINPARKTRPIAPRLTVTPAGTPGSIPASLRRRNESTSSSSSASSGDEMDKTTGNRQLHLRLSEKIREDVTEPSERLEGQIASSIQQNGNNDDPHHNQSNRNNEGDQAQPRKLTPPVSSGNVNLIDDDFEPDHVKSLGDISMETLPTFGATNFLNEEHLQQAKVIAETALNEAVATAFARMAVKSDDEEGLNVNHHKLGQDNVHANADEANTENLVLS